MAILNFILISEFNAQKEVELDLRHQLDGCGSGDSYRLTCATYEKAPKLVTTNKYHRIFAALCRDNLQKQVDYLVALGKTSTPVTVLTCDRVTDGAMAKIRQRSPNLEAISRQELQSDVNLCEFFYLSIEQRLHSHACIREDTEQWKKIAQFDAILQNVEADLQRMEACIYGTTSSDGRDNGMLAASTWVLKNQAEFDTMRLTLRDVVNGLADLKTDFSAYLASESEKKNASWQTRLAIGLALLGLVGSIGSAIVPLVFDGDGDRPAVVTPR